MSPEPFLLNNTAQRKHILHFKTLTGVLIIFDRTIEFILMNEEILIEKLRSIKPTLKNQYFVKELGYFGSYASGSADENSDVDILVEFSQPVGWEFFRVQDLLEETLKVKVDLVTERAIRPQMRERIFQNLKFV